MIVAVELLLLRCLSLRAVTLLRRTERHSYYTQRKTRVRVCVCGVQVIVCVILTGDLRVVAQPSGLSDSDEDALLAVNTSSRTFVVWTARTWFVYSLSGLLLSTAQLTSVQAADILTIDVYDDDDELGGQRLCIVWKTQEQGIVVADSQTLTQKLKHISHDLCLQSNVIALSRRRQLVYTCSSLRHQRHQ